MSTERTRRGPARGMMGRPGGGHGPGGPGMMPGEKAKDFKGTFKKLLHYLGSYKWAVLVAVSYTHLDVYKRQGWYRYHGYRQGCSGSKGW